MVRGQITSGEPGPQKVEPRSSGGGLETRRGVCRDDFAVRQGCPTGASLRQTTYRETLPNGARLISTTGVERDNYDEIVVPEVTSSGGRTAISADSGSRPSRRRNGLGGPVRSQLGGGAENHTFSSDGRRMAHGERVEALRPTRWTTLVRAAATARERRANGGERRRGDQRSTIARRQLTAVLPVEASERGLGRRRRADAPRSLFSQALMGSSAARLRLDARGGERLSAGSYASAGWRRIVSCSLRLLVWGLLRRSQISREAAQLPEIVGAQGARVVPGSMHRASRSIRATYAAWPARS